jgi:hypothetical protein
MQRIAWFVLVFAAASTQADSTRSIYRCETAAGIVFADRPCDSGAQVYEPNLSGVSIVETVTPPPRPAAKPAQPPRSRGKSSGSATANAEACAKLDQSLKKIASTLRAGYNAKQGERLKERKRELEAKRRTQKC